MPRCSMFSYTSTGHESLHTKHIYISTCFNNTSELGGGGTITGWVYNRVGP